LQEETECGLGVWAALNDNSFWVIY